MAASEVVGTMRAPPAEGLHGAVGPRTAASGSVATLIGASPTSSSEMSRVHARLATRPGQRADGGAILGRDVIGCPSRRLRGAGTVQRTRRRDPLSTGSPRSMASMDELDSYLIKMGLPYEQVGDGTWVV